MKLKLTISHESTTIEVKSRGWPMTLHYDLQDIIVSTLQNMLKGAKPMQLVNPKVGVK